MRMTSMISTEETRSGPVLVLGGGGKLGQMLARFWPDRADLILQSRQQGVGDTCFDPLADAPALRSAAQGARAILCLAGVTPAHARQSGDAMALNTRLALAAFDAAPSGTRVFLASSAAVYGAATGVCAEAAVLAPVSDYGRAKLAMETAALARDHPITALRIGNVAGADAILGGWQTGMEIDVLSDGQTPRRSYIGPQTFARVIHDLTLAADLPEILNLAAPGVVAMGDLLDAAGLAWHKRPAGPAVIAEVRLDTTRLEQVIDFAPKDSTAAGLVAEWHNMKDPT